MTFRRSLTRLLPDLRAYSRSICPDPSDADDLVGDAVERALTAQSRPQETAGLRPWLFRIVRNLNIDRHRRDRVRLDHQADALRAAVPADRQVRAVAEDVLVRLAFERLKPMEREILFLVDVTGLTYAEASAVLGIPVGTVMSRVSRARKSLLARVGDGAVGPAGVSDADRPGGEDAGKKDGAETAECAEKGRP